MKRDRGDKDDRYSNQQDQHERYDRLEHRDNRNFVHTRKPYEINLTSGAVKIGLAMEEIPGAYCTICYIYPNSRISVDCYQELQSFIFAVDRPKPGKLGYYTLKFMHMWGENTNSSLIDNVSQLAYLQQYLFAQIYGILYKFGYSHIIENQRYPIGLPPPHVSIRQENRDICQRYFVNPGVKVRISFQFWALTEIPPNVLDTNRPKSHSHSHHAVHHQTQHQSQHQPHARIQNNYSSNIPRSDVRDSDIHAEKDST